MSAGLWMACSNVTNGVCACGEEADGGFSFSSTCGAQDGNTTGVMSGILRTDPSGGVGGSWKAPVGKHMRTCKETQCVDLTRRKMSHDHPTQLS